MSAVQLIDVAHLNEYALSNGNRVKKVTVMSGELKERLKALKKDGKTDMVEKLKEQHSLKIALNFKRVLLNVLLDLASSPQSLIVAIQNQIIRPMGDDLIEGIVNGTADFKSLNERYSEYGISFKHGVVTVEVNKYLNRPTRVSMKAPEEKVFSVLDKITDTEILEKIKKDIEKRLAK